MSLSVLIHLPSDIITEYIFLILKSVDRYALLSAYPELSLKIKWESVYQEKTKPKIDPDLMSIYLDIFKTKDLVKERLNQMQKCYDAVRIDCDDCDDGVCSKHSINIYDLNILDAKDFVDEYQLDEYQYKTASHVYDRLLELKYANLGLNK